jgi:DNA modification methylase
VNSPLPDGVDFHVHHGDCISLMEEMPPDCVDLAVYSPPFPSVYSYTSFAEDMGNDEDDAEVRLHFSFFFRRMLRVMKPGRIMMVHCSQIVRMKRAGGEGLFDFRGLLIRLAQRAGFIYDYDWAVRKGPQQQAIITKSRCLQFAGLEDNRLQSRGANPDYLIKMRVPGDARVPVDSEGQVSRNEWIEWAEGTWDAEKYPISVDGKVRAFTLNTEEAKGPDDCRHICALQLSVIDRLVRLYSNPGEIVFDPFAGICSTGFVAVRRGRRFFGTEMKSEYWKAGIANLERAVKMRDESQVMLWDLLESAS